MKSEKRPIDIEDLLRLKRAERPPVEFWAEFDRQLRAKQLSALVAKRPWWQTLSAAVARPAFYRLPLGAAAALVVTFVTVRQLQHSSDPIPANISAAPDAIAASDSPAQAPAAVALSPVEAGAGVAEVEGRASAAVLVARAESSAVPDNASASLVVSTMTEPARPAFLGGATRSDFALTDASSALSSIGTPLTAAPAVDVPISRGMLVQVASGFEARALPSRAPVEPLQQITSPAERTRAKLLTAMMSMTASDTPNRTGERTADRISEERLYDQVQRFGARGAGVSMKF